MIVGVQWSRLRQTAWWEYAIRFVFGGSVTVLAGWIARRWGPVTGGLFLAFPGIFPAGITLLERHEREKKRRHGLSGENRARMVSAVASAGATIGACGLVAFGVAAWSLLPRITSWLALSIAAIGWLVVSVIGWSARLRA